MCRPLEGAAVGWFFGWRGLCPHAPLRWSCSDPAQALAGEIDAMGVVDQVSRMASASVGSGSPHAIYDTDLAGENGRARPLRSEDLVEVSAGASVDVIKLPNRRR